MRILVVGSGLAGFTVAEALAAQYDVTLLTAETHGYYPRPRLSHAVSSDVDLVLKRFGSLAPLGVMPGVRVEAIDRERQEVVLEDRRALSYDVLILATGSAARIPPALEPYRAQFFTLNSMDDLLALRARRREVGKARWAIVGGGLIGCELASDLDRAGDRVAIFHGGAQLLERQLSEKESQALHEHFLRRGVELFYEQDVREPFPRSRFDAMVVCTGFAPRVKLARDAGLATAQGIVVNDYLRSADPAIYAVGDVAEVGGRLYPFIAPIRSQALWLAQHLAGRSHAPWTPPAFSPAAKIHGFAVQRQAVAVRV